MVCWLCLPIDCYWFVGCFHCCSLFFYYVVFHCWLLSLLFSVTALLVVFIAGAFLFYRFAFHDNTRTSMKTTTKTIAMRVSRLLVCWWFVNQQFLVCCFVGGVVVVIVIVIVVVCWFVGGLLTNSWS